MVSTNVWRNAQTHCYNKKGHPCKIYQKALGMDISLLKLYKNYIVAHNVYTYIILS